MKTNNFFVGIQCFTYNQSLYIKDTLSGFIMQQTSFPYIAMVVDDASTDGEQDIIASYVEERFDSIDSQETYYANITFAHHKTNKNCYIVVLYLKENLYSKNMSHKKYEYLNEWRENIKYEAICEGDDYWTNPLKLQRQVDFLEANPEYSMCFHNVKVVSDSCHLQTDIYSHLKNKDYSIEEFIRIWTIPTCSVVFRSIISQYIPENEKFAVGDNVLFTTCALYGKVRCINEYMGCYRRNEGGWTNSVDDTIPKRMIRHYEGMIESFPQIDKNIFNKMIAINMAVLAYKYLKLNDIRFFNIMISGIKKYHFNFILTILKHIYTRL